MKKAILLLCFVTATSSAYAADAPKAISLEPLAHAEPREKPRDPTDPGPKKYLLGPSLPVSWSGWYFGLNAGAAWGRTNWINTTSGSSTGTFSVNGGLVGGTLGANWQFGNLVWGLESDLAWTNASGTSSNNCPLGCETEASWLGTARARVGYAFDSYYTYVTGGAAFGGIRASTPGVASVADTKIGWALGGGVEFKINRALSAKIEALHVQLGDLSCGLACGATLPRNVTFSDTILRVGLNYSFSFGGPKDRDPDDPGPK